MFKKQNKLVPPSSLTSEQILEDLVTFKPPELPTPEPSDRIRTLPSNSEVESWWKIFETFVADVEDFRVLRNHMNDLRSNLIAANLDLSTTSNDIKGKIENTLKLIHQDSLTITPSYESVTIADLEE